MAFKYIDSDFLPEESKYTIMDFWGITTEEDFNKKCERLEKDAIAVIKARVNIKVLEDEYSQPGSFSVLPTLCESFVTAKLLEKVINRVDYENTAKGHSNDFWDTLNSLRETQKEEKIKSDETVVSKRYHGPMVI